VIAPTQPNVLTELNGTDPGWVYNNLQPGPTPPWNSIFDELTAHGRSWRIYYAGGHGAVVVPGVAATSRGAGKHHGVVPVGRLLADRLQRARWQ
jgi:hypothetical protein